MVGKPRKSRSASASAETKAPRGKRSASISEQQEAIETTEPPTKKMALMEDNEEPGPEPTGQQVARLELKIQELDAENERLKEQVEKLQMEQADSKPKKKATAKAQSKVKPASARAQFKRKSAKAKPAKA
ncbi:hypothetical protein F442_13637 [Phytophthora nicotianae P10297]|uniref:Uncharacterized protein n=1 Tax=Phytophthora nicotianae P10297 TaxID=1317064 RepID=W2YUL3_PHYNI|nr:hypothetical protein F442_13637 [Phytophthora nicotianae P10297]